MVRYQASNETQLPVSRIKKIMKKDSEVCMLSADAAFIMAKATELFLIYTAEKSHNQAVKKKRKTVQGKDIEKLVTEVDNLQFLDGLPLE